MGGKGDHRTSRCSVSKFANAFLPRRLRFLLYYVFVFLFFLGGFERVKGMLSAEAVFVNPYRNGCSVEATDETSDKGFMEDRISYLYLCIGREFVGRKCDPDFDPEHNTGGVEHAFCRNVLFCPSPVILFLSLAPLVI